jgi:hypothetical protein
VNAGPSPFQSELILDTTLSDDPSANKEGLLRSVSPASDGGGKHKNYCEFEDQGQHWQLLHSHHYAINLVP